MYNQITDQLRLVEEERFKTLPLLSHTRPLRQNESQEIFRNGRYIGSVDPRDQGSSPIKVCNGDVIYRVKLLPQIYTCVGTLTTKDNYIYLYEVTLELQVTDSYLLVQRYLERIVDPVKWMITQFERLFQQHAVQLEHDKVRNAGLPLERWNKSFSTSVGIKITQHYKFTLKDDPKRSEELTIYQDTKIKRASILAQADIRRLEDRLARDLEAEQKDHARREQKKQKNFNREEATTQQMHELYMNLRKTAAEELKEILRDRIRETYDRDEEISEVAEESMKLLNAFHESLQRGAIIDAIPLSRNMQEQSEDMSDTSNADMPTNTTDDETPLKPNQSQEGRASTRQNLQQMRRGEVDTEQIRAFDSSS